jgi:hypothetical protein
MNNDIDLYLIHKKLARGRILMSFNPIDHIKKRSREEWYELLKQSWVSLRIWIQEHGELGFIAAFVGGIIFVLFFKLFFSLLVLFGLVCFVIWSIADPKGVVSNENHNSDSTSNSNNTHSDQ